MTRVNITIYRCMQCVSDKVCRLESSDRYFVFPIPSNSPFSKISSYKFFFVFLKYCTEFYKYLNRMFGIAVERV